MLIVEGPDMVGKTTLAPILKRLVREEWHMATGRAQDACPVRRRKFGMDERGWGVDEWVGSVTGWTVCDRWALSGVMYGPEYPEGDPRLTMEQYVRIDSEALSQEKAAFKVLLVCASPERYERLLEEVYPSRGEAYSAEACRRVNRRYLDLLTGVGDPLVDRKIVLGEEGWPTDHAASLRELCRAYVRDQLALDESAGSLQS